MNRGTLYAIGAYTAWGVFPLYWKWLQDIAALQLVSHRVLWSCVALCAFLLAARQWPTLRAAIADPRTLRTYLLAALLVSVNWIVFTFAIYSGHVIETSLGYFINPLISVLIGVLFLGERLRRAQWAAIAITTAGVLYLTLAYGSPPWIALALALSFALYGLVKKGAPLGALPGLTLETAFLVLPAAGYLLYSGETGSFSPLTPVSFLLVVGMGLITTLPLLMFASAARRIPFSLLGVLQYIAPTLQFLFGVLLYKEPFGHEKLIGFALVWVALAIFGIEGIIAHRKSAARQLA